MVCALNLLPIRYFAAGTGAAGLVGASIWWLVRGLGVRTGVGLSSVSSHRSQRYPFILTMVKIMPLTIPLAYYLILPRANAFVDLSLPEEYDDETIGAPSTVPYTAIPTEDIDDDDSSVGRKRIEKVTVALSARDKWRLVRPLLPKYMVPLCKFHFDRTVRAFLTGIILSLCLSGLSTRSCHPRPRE